MRLLVHSMSNFNAQLELTASPRHLGPQEHEGWEGGHKLNKAVIERRTGSSRWTFGISQLQAHTAVTNLYDNMHYFFIPRLSLLPGKSISTSWARSAGSDSSTEGDFSCLEYDAVQCLQFMEDTQFYVCFRISTHSPTHFPATYLSFSLWKRSFPHAQWQVNNQTPTTLCLRSCRQENGHFLAFI